MFSTDVESLYFSTFFYQLCMQLKMEGVLYNYTYSRSLPIYLREREIQIETLTKNNFNSES